MTENYTCFAARGKVAMTRKVHGLAPPFRHIPPQTSIATGNIAWVRI
jgi:hypothetical protein